MYKQHSNKKSISYLLALSIGLIPSSVLAQSISVSKLNSAPRVDGNSKDWSSIPAETVQLRNTKPNGKSKISSVKVKSGVYGDSVYFLFEWKDNTHDNQHKPFVWSSKRNKYVKGKQREDRLAIQFAMSGEYDVNWVSGKLFTADTWHWKAARTNGLGLAHDKMTIVRSEKISKSYKAKAKNGKTVYIKRPGDKGSKLYTTKRYSSKVNEIMPKYILAKAVNGSIADVKAKGVWKNGKWILEMSRKLNTGNPDDVTFRKGKSVKGGIAVFDHSGNNDHNHSNILRFKF